MLYVFNLSGSGQKVIGILEMWFVKNFYDDNQYPESSLRKCMNMGSC